MNMENNQMDYYNYNQGMPQAPKKKRGSTLSILALVFSIIALPLTCFLVGVIFTILALILGVTALVLKQENKGLAIGGIVISAITLILEIVAVVACVSYLENVDPEEMMEVLVPTYNKLMAQTDDYEIEDKLSGYAWKMDDDSILCLYDDGSFCWFQSEETLAWYEGTYSLSQGNDAVDDLKLHGFFNEDEFEKQDKFLRSDVYYLTLDTDTVVIDGDVIGNDTTQEYSIMIYVLDPTQAQIMNLGSCEDGTLERTSMIYPD